jgi:N4-gp56 family major capsid protein
MSTTVIPWGDPKAVKRYSPKAHMDVMKSGYFTRKFVGRGDNNVIEERTELEADAGDTISFDLAVSLRGEPTFGDTTLDGKEEGLRFYTDTVSIDQVRKAVSAGGRMSRKRTVHDLRRIASANSRDYWKAFMDELFMMTLAGSRGINEGFKMSTSFTGFANNAFRAPSSSHLLFGGAATSKATITTSDKMGRLLVERAAVKAEMLTALDPEAANMVPLSVDGGDHFVLLMSEFSAFDLRTGTGAGDWLDIQKQLISAAGAQNPVMKGGLGMINNVIMHSHRNVIRFSDYGSGANLPACRNLLMGRQAAALAYGTTSGQRMIWVEETKDYKNNPTVASGYIMGVKKTQFNNRDFGVMALDTYAKDPNAA